MVSVPRCIRVRTAIIDDGAWGCRVRHGPMLDAGRRLCGPTASSDSSVRAWPMTALALYAGLFMAAFLAATLLPMQSEAALVALLLTGDHAPWLLLAIASVGNV